jgi:predicted phosphohydrolase
MHIFSGWDDYMNRLEKNWRSSICPEDTVIIAGDICWAMRIDDAFNDFSFINNLPGKKILIKGNHDYWWTTRKKIEEFLQKYNFHSISILHNSAIPIGRFCVCGTRGWLPAPETEQDEKILQRELCRLTTSALLAAKTGLEPIAFLHYPPIYNSYICEQIIDILIKYDIRKCYYGHLHNISDVTRLKRHYKGIDFHLVSCDFTEFSPVFVG